MENRTRKGTLLEESCNITRGLRGSNTAQPLLEPILHGEENRLQSGRGEAWHAEGADVRPQTLSSQQPADPALA